MNESVGKKLTKKDKEKSMSMEEIVELRKGRIGAKFDRFKLKNDEEHRKELSFSIIGPKRNLDLESDSEHMLAIFINQFEIVLKHVKYKKEVMDERKKSQKKDDYHRQSMHSNANHTTPEKSSLKSDSKSNIDSLR